MSSKLSPFVFNEFPDFSAANVPTFDDIVRDEKRMKSFDESIFFPLPFDGSDSLEIGSREVSIDFDAIENVLTHLKHTDSDYRSFREPSQSEVQNVIPFASKSDEASNNSEE